MGFNFETLLSLVEVGLILGAIIKVICKRFHWKLKFIHCFLAGLAVYGLLVIVMISSGMQC